MPNNTNLINAGILITGLAGGISSAVVVFFNSDRSTSFFALSVVFAFIGGFVGVGGSIIIINNVVTNVFPRNNIANAVHDDVVGRPVVFVGRPVVDQPVRSTSFDDLGRISQLCLQLEKSTKELDLEKAIYDIRILINNNYNVNNNINYSSNKFLIIADVKLLTNDPPTEKFREIIIENLLNVLEQGVVVKDVTIDFLLDAIKRHNDFSFDGKNQDDRDKTTEAIKRFIDCIKNNKPYESPWVIKIQDGAPSSSTSPRNSTQLSPQILGVGFN